MKSQILLLITNSLQFEVGVKRFIQDEKELSVVVEDSGLTDRAIELMNQENKQLKRAIFETIEGICKVIGNELEESRGGVELNPPADDISEFQKVFVGTQEKKANLVRIGELKAQPQSLMKQLHKNACALNLENKSEIVRRVETMTQTKVNKPMPLAEKVIQNVLCVHKPKQ